jgi:hypothetical protein
MDRHRDARDYAPARLRAEAHRLQEETKREPDPQTKHDLTQRANLLEHTAEMLDAAEPDRQSPEYPEPRDD